MPRDYYEVLEIPNDASPEEIKKAYYKLTLKLHPDRGEGFHEAFQELSEAYAVLGDENQRAQYKAPLFNSRSWFNLGIFNPQKRNSVNSFCYLVYLNIDKYHNELTLKKFLDFFKNGFPKPTEKHGPVRYRMQLLNAENYDHFNADRDFFAWEKFSDQDVFTKFTLKIYQSYDDAKILLENCQTKELLKCSTFLYEEKIERETSQWQRCDSIDLLEDALEEHAQCRAPCLVM